VAPDSGPAGAPAQDRELGGLTVDDIEFGMAVLGRLLSAGFEKNPRSIGTFTAVKTGPETAQPSALEPAEARDANLAEDLSGEVRKTKRKRKLPKTIPRDEVEAILDGCNLRAPTGLRDRVMLELMFRSGVRIGELRRLLVRDVDAESGDVHIVAGKVGDRTAYFDTARVSPLLERWIDTRRRELRARLGTVPREAPLFCTIRTPAGHEITERTVQQMVKRRAANAGVDPAKVTPHRFRHTFATEALNEPGVTVYDVQQLLGHASLKSTEQYLHVSNAHLREKIQRRKR